MVLKAAVHPHSVARGSFAPTPGTDGKLFEPAPAPKLSRTPGHAPRPAPAPGADTRAVLREFGFSDQDADGLLQSGAVSETMPAETMSDMSDALEKTLPGGSAEREEREKNTIQKAGFNSERAKLLDWCE